MLIVINAISIYLTIGLICFDLKVFLIFYLVLLYGRLIVLGGI